MTRYTRDMVETRGGRPAAWTVEAGRCLARDSKPVLTLHIITSATERFAIAPWRADALTHRIAELLNEHGDGIEE